MVEVNSVSVEELSSPRDGYLHPTWIMRAAPTGPNFPKLKELAAVGGRMRISFDGKPERELEIISVWDDEDGGLEITLAALPS